MPGIGIDTKEIARHADSRVRIRKELGLKEEDFFLLSVGELSGRKNHETIIKAIHQLDRSDIKYFIAGKGMGKDNEEVELTQEDNLIVLGEE